MLVARAGHVRRIVVVALVLRPAQRTFESRTTPAGFPPSPASVNAAYLNTRAGVVSTGSTNRGRPLMVPMLETRLAVRARSLQLPWARLRRWMSGCATTAGAGKPH